MFHVGQMVVCVDDTPLTLGGIQCTLDGLTRDRVYTVRETGLYCPHGTGQPCIRVAEIYRETRYGIVDCPYAARRFRPVTERQTDISIFTDMLTSAPKEIEHVGD